MNDDSQLKTDRPEWRMIACVAGLLSLWFSDRAIGQAEYEAPQYPQYVQYPQGGPPVAPAAPGAQVTLSADQLDQLLGPVALYPDPLLSLIFPAATYPQDVVAAGQWLAATPNPTEADIAAQGWDESIKGLVHYPSVLNMMSGQIDWTQTVGAAFLNQQQDVLHSVQRLRAEAQADRNLQTNQQEQVLDDDGAILIEPVDPNMIYVPQYDPNLVYNSAYSVSFGVGLPIGLWDDNDFDWGGDYIVVGGGWYGGWNHPAAWDQHPPAWDHHPAGWAATPRQWARTSQSSAPRVTATSVSHLNLNQPRAATAVTPAAGAGRKSPAQVGREPAAQPSNNAFDSTQSRADVQRAVQRTQPATARPAAARPAPAPPAAADRPQETVQPRSSPRAATAEPAQRSEAPAAQRAAPSSAFSGGSAGDTRAQSARGHASGHR